MLIWRVLLKRFDGEGLMEIAFMEKIGLVQCDDKNMMKNDE